MIWAVLLSIGVHLAGIATMVVAHLWCPAVPPAHRGSVDVDVVAVGAQPVRRAAALDQPSIRQGIKPAAMSSPATAFDQEAKPTETDHVASGLTVEDGGVSRVLSPAEYADWVRAHNSPPAYPRLSNLRREQGRVVLRAVVGRDGRLDSLDLEQGSGYEQLDRASLDAVRRWAFPPFLSQDTVVDLKIPFKFSLEES